MELSQLAGFGRAVNEWRKVRNEALYGWIKCDGDRLYHPVVAEKANEAWAEKQTYRWRKECDRLRKMNIGRKEQGLDPLEMPLNPTERAQASVGKTAAVKGFPTENGLKVREGKVRDIKKEDAAPQSAAARSKVEQVEPSAAIVSSPEAELFRRGKEILGTSAGGFVGKLLTSKDGNIALARAALENASTKGDPREYLGATINGQQASARDIGGVRSSRDM